MSTTIEHEVITIIPRDKKESWEALRQQCWDLRIKVYIHEQGFPLGDEFDKYEDTATHFLLILLPSHEPVATIRCIKFDGYYKLGCLVVLKERRQLKLGQKLAEALHSYVKEEARQALVTQGEDYTDKTVRIIAYSQVQAKAFYAKLGYTSEVSELLATIGQLNPLTLLFSQGDEFEEAGQPHQLMSIHLALAD